MKKNLLIYLFIIVSSGCYAQVNSEIMPKTAFKSQSQPSINLPDYSNSTFTIKFQSLAFQPGGNNISFNTNLNPLRYTWIGETQASNFRLNDTPINSVYQFDVNGNLTNSVMSIRLNK